MRFMLDLSDRVMQTLTAMSPSIEIYSIDEAFINLSGVTNCVPLSTFGHEIRTNVLKNTGLTVGVGIAQTKTLAKLITMPPRHGAARAALSTYPILCANVGYSPLVPVGRGLGRWAKNE